jgi:hypothetical protein
VLLLTPTAPYGKISTICYEHMMNVDAIFCLEICWGPACADNQSGMPIRDESISLPAPGKKVLNFQFFESLISFTKIAQAT